MVPIFEYNCKSVNVLFFKGNLTTAFNYHGREFLLIDLPSIEN